MADSNPLQGMGFSVANKMIDSVFNEHAADKAFSRQKALLQMQNQMNIDNWRMNNAYNTPERQKERLIAAGLNPDMMYGQQGIAGSFAPPSGASAPSAPQAQMGSADAANAALAISQAKKAGEETLAQQIRNQYLAREIQLILTDLEQSGNLKKEQIGQIKQSVLESQANIDALRQRLGNEKYDRVLATITAAGQLDKWQHENDLNDEQKKWLGTHAMAALIGAKGAAAQAQAMANAINLFRDPKQLRKLIDDYLVEIKKGLKDLKDGIVGKGNSLVPTLKDIDTWLDADSIVGGMYGYPFFN